MAALQAEVSEARVQYEAVCVLLQRRPQNEDIIEGSESEGDDREHLIVPPKPITIEDDIRGKPVPSLRKGLDAARG